MDEIEEYEESFCSAGSDLAYEIRTNYRLLRKKWFLFWRKRIKKDFTQVLIVTADDNFFDYIRVFQQQYPDKKISVLRPIKGSPKGMERAGRHFEYYIQNKMNYAKMYKYPQNNDNIDVYGIYSPLFSDIEDSEDFYDIKYLAPFMKCARICAKKLKPDIVQTKDIPFFLGGEFETKFRFPIRVFQTVTDFSKYGNTEPFWAIINIVDKNGMKRICRDKVIKKCIASLFNIHDTENFCKLRDYLDVIYDNYLKFKTLQREEDNQIFEHLNTRILKMFSFCFIPDSYCYNSMLYTIKRCDYWAVLSKTYYKNLFKEDNVLPLGKIIKKTKNKSGYVYYGTGNEREKIHNDFDENNFREERVKNKQYLLKEFSQQRVMTKFTDMSLFTASEEKIYGYLDSFYDSTLMLAVLGNNTHEQGIDIAIKTILHLFDKSKNVQIILNVKGGMENDDIMKFIDFCEKTPAMNGRWLFIDGEINLPQFLASSDLLLMPFRENTSDNLHYEAIKYGCIPIVSNSGILNDSVKDIYDDMTSGCVFKTDEPLSSSKKPDEVFERAVLKALKFYSMNQSSYNAIIKNCLNFDSSWNFKIIEKYNNIYEDLV